MFTSRNCWIMLVKVFFPVIPATALPADAAARGEASRWYAASGSTNGGTRERAKTIVPEVVGKWEGTPVCVRGHGMHMQRIFHSLRHRLRQRGLERGHLLCHFRCNLPLHGGRGGHARIRRLCS